MPLRFLVSNSSDTTGEGVHWATVALSIERDDEGAIEMHDEGDEMGDECAYESGTWDDEYAYEHEMWDDECAYENEMWDDHLMPGSWDTGGGDSEEANAPSPACAFATQADNLERIGAAASLAPYLSKRAAELRADFTVAFDAAVAVSKQFGQALLVGDRLHSMMEAARELLVRNECGLPLDDMLKWQRLHGEMVRKLCESGVELRELKSARPSVQRIARLQNVPIE